MTMPKKFLIIAANARDAHQCAKENNIKMIDCKYASSPETILGISGMQVIEAGGAFEHRDYERIMESINWCLATGHLMRYSLG